MIEKGLRNKLRFDSAKGLLTIEDLYDLPLLNGVVCLNNIANSIYKELQQEGKMNFVTEKSVDNELLELKFDIVKHVIEVKKSELSVAKEEASKHQKRQELLAALADIQKDEIKSKSKEDILKELEEL